MKEKIMGGMEKFSKAMVQPLMYLSVIGILMVIGVILTNTTITDTLTFLKWWPIQLVGNLIYKSLMAVINNLNVLFCIGIAAAVAKKDKHQAAIIALLSFIMYLTANNTSLTFFDQLAQGGGMLGLVGTGQANVFGIQVLDTGVFSGIVLGFVVGAVFNKTSSKKFDRAWLQMWAGAKWTLMWMVLIAIGMGFLTTFVWPPIQSAMDSIANMISNTGNFGLFLYGALERLLIPTGLHHLVYAPFQFSSLGGSIEMGGQVISGAYPIYMAELSNPAITEFSESIRWMYTGFAKTFAYVGICAAFIYTAKPENKAKTRAMLIPLAISTVLVAITEPIDFLFVFVAPLLFLLHSIIAGAFMVILNVLEIRAGMTGISSMLVNMALGVERTQWPLLLLLAVIEIIVYFLIFTFVIKKFNLKTPGREEDTETTEIETASTAANPATYHYDSLIEGLGGAENIVEIENCFTRLRVNLKDVKLLDKDKINQVKNSGIVEKGNDIQIIFGLQVTDICNDMKKLLHR